MGRICVQAHDNYTGKWGQEFGYSLWNIAVLLAPYRTGNLRSQIQMINNSTDKKTIIYNDYNAYYLNFLEEGQGRNKKHKGFISIDTVNDFIDETIFYIASGETNFNGVPVVYLRSDRARNYERDILFRNQIFLNKRLTASDRALLSREYYDKRFGTPQQKQQNRSKLPVSLAMNARDKIGKDYKGNIVEYGVQKGVMYYD